MSPSSRDDAAGTLPRGRRCHAAPGVAKSVAMCHAAMLRSDGAMPPRGFTRHGDAAAGAAGRVASNAAPLTRAGLVPLAEMIARDLLRRSQEDSTIT